MVNWCQDSATEGATLFCLRGHERGELQHGEDGKGKRFPPHHNKTACVWAAFSRSAGSTMYTQQRSKVRVDIKIAGLNACRDFLCAAGRIKTKLKSPGFAQGGI